MFSAIGHMLSLHHQSPVPLRAQVEQLLGELVRQPEHQKGALLPDLVALAAQLRVGCGTVLPGSRARGCSRQ